MSKPKLTNFFNQAIADGLNELGYGVDVPSEKGEMRFGAECHEVCTIADKLNELIESWPLIYKQAGVDSYWRDFKYPDDLAQARLAFVEPIKREPCNHLRREYGYKNSEPIAWCQDCRAELAAVWSEKKNTSEDVNDPRN